jgi:pyruvate/2-oxoglutarate dehydrogenase complex dihydrolipoamide acyltransferase (E2) component
VKDGDLVKKDQPLFELETDKITSEGTAEAAGTITLKVEAGSEVKIGEVVASIETALRRRSRGPAPAPASPPGPEPEPAAEAGRAAAARGVPRRPPARGGDGRRP